MMLRPRSAPGPGVGEPQYAMAGNKGVLHDDVLAASAAEPIDEPIVFDLDILDGEQKEGAVMRRFRSRRLDDGAEPDPARMVDPAGERPTAAQHKAAFGRDRRPRRGKAGASERVAPIAP